MNLFNNYAINFYRQRILKSNFLKNIVTLTTGSFFSQLILLGFSPVLTRLYEPSDFANFYLFNTLSTTMLPAIALRYNIALVVVKEKKESDKLFKLSIWVAIFISALTFIIIILFKNFFIDILNAESIRGWLIFFPVVTFFSGLNLIFIDYSNRNKQYKFISFILIIKSLFGTLIAFIIPFLHIGIELNGLIISLLMTPIFSVFLFLLKYKKFSRNLNINFNLIFLAKKYRKFPLFSALPSFLNNLTASLPILFLTKYYPLAIVGYYSLSNRVAIAPLGFISKSISQVHLRKVSELIHSDKNPIDYILKLTIILIFVMSIPFLLFTFFGREIIPIIFGNEWEMSGVFISILMPAISIKFIVSTLSPVFSSTGNNKISALWQIFSFISTFFVLYIFSGNLSTKNILIAITITDVILYCLYYFLILYSVRNPKNISY